MNNKIDIISPEAIRSRIFKVQFFHLKERTRTAQLKSEMYETLRYQNDINEMISKEQNSISAQIESLNDAMAQLQADYNQKQLTPQASPIGCVVRKDE